MRKSLFLFSAGICCSLAAAEAQACMQSTGYKQIFFPTRPTNVPAQLTVLKVRAPIGADQWITNVEVLEDAKGAPANAELPLTIAATNPARPCDMYDIGLLGSPAYVVGVYKRGRDGITYFYALWLDAVYPKWREPKIGDLTSSIPRSKQRLTGNDQ